MYGLEEQKEPGQSLLVMHWWTLIEFLWIRKSLSEHMRALTTYNYNKTNHNHLVVPYLSDLPPVWDHRFHIGVTKDCYYRNYCVRSAKYGIRKYKKYNGRRACTVLSYKALFLHVSYRMYKYIHARKTYILFYLSRIYGKILSSNQQFLAILMKYIIYINNKYYMVCFVELGILKLRYGWLYSSAIFKDKTIITL